MTAWLEGQTGRRWRSIEDTGTGVNLRGGSAWANWTRGNQDYYYEGVLLWLDVDTLIRSRTDNRRSLDDFARDFFGQGRVTGIEVAPYTLHDIVSTLNKVAPYNWQALFESKVLDVTPQVNVEGIERAGYRFLYTDEPEIGRGMESSTNDAIWNSIGIKVEEDGKLKDVRRGGPADIAKLAPRQTIARVGESLFSLKALTAEIGRKKQDRDSPIQLTVTQEDEEWAVAFDYHGVLRYPRLERQAGKLDVLSAIISEKNISLYECMVDEKNIIAIEPMSRLDALALLEKKLGWHDDAVKLATILEYMPLAIVQAAAYISQMAPRYSVQEYLQDFQKSDRKRTGLLKHKGKQLRRDWEAENSILITWQISFNYIQEIRPSAADLLSLMSFFDRQGIPETLLRSRDEQRNSRQDQKENNDKKYPNVETGYYDDDEDNTSLSSRSDEFEDDILALRNFSFISVNTDGITFEMHRLVQLATREWLKAHGQQERWREQSKLIPPCVDATLSMRWLGVEILDDDIVAFKKRMVVALPLSAYL